MESVCECVSEHRRKRRKMSPLFFLTISYIQYIVVSHPSYPFLSAFLSPQTPPPPQLVPLSASCLFYWLSFSRVVYTCGGKGRECGQLTYGYATEGIPTQPIALQEG